MRWNWFVFWGVVWGGTFAVAEYVAVKDENPGDTLSENLQALVYAVPGGPIFFLAFFAWFIPHILIRTSKNKVPEELVEKKDSLEEDENGD